MATMSPWEALSWMTAPQEFVVTAVGGTPIVLAPADPARVVLMMTCGSTTNNNAVNLSGSAVQGVGIPVSASQPPVILIQKDHGALCQARWFASSFMGSIYTAYTLSLRDWPRNDSSTNSDLINAIAALIRALQGGNYVRPKDWPVPPTQPDLPNRWRG